MKTPDTVTLRRPDGHVYLALTRDRAGGWIHARWLGVQTLDTIQAGGLVYLRMLEQEPCTKLLNDHRELVGRFLGANQWIAEVWTPCTLRAGLRYIAQVLSPGVFGQMSMQDLHQRISSQFELRLFGHLAEAQTWLNHTP